MRAAATGIDLLALAGVPLVLTTVLVFTALLLTDEPPPALGIPFRGAQLLFVTLFALRDVGNRSPGKTLFGLRAVRVDGEPVTALDSLVRNVPLLIPGWNLLEAWCVLRRPDTRRPGDLAAGTIVLES